MNGFLNMPQQQQQHGNIPVSPTFPDATSQMGSFFNLNYNMPIEKQRVQNYSTNDLQQQLQQEQLRQLARLYQSHPLQQQTAATVNPAVTSFKNDYPSAGASTTTVDTRDDSHLIKPLSQSDTITATDNNGRVRLIVPVNDEETRTGHRKDGNDADLLHSEISSTPSIRRTNKGNSKN